MNSNFFIAFALIALIAFSACIQQSEEQQDEVDFLAEDPGLRFETTPIQEPLLLGQSHSSDKVKVTVFSARKVNSYTFLPEREAEEETEELPELGIGTEGLENLDIEGEEGLENIGIETEAENEGLEELEEGFIAGAIEEDFNAEYFSTPISVFPAEENTFYLIDVSIKNLSGEEIYAGAESFSLLASNGYRYDASLFQDILKSLGMLVKIQPNQEVSGTILFEVPKNFSNWKLQYRFGLPVYWRIA